MLLFWFCFFKKIQESIGGIKEIISFQKERYFSDLFEKYIFKRINVLYKYHFFSKLPRIYFETGCVSSETTTSRFPDVHKFMANVHRYLRGDYSKVATDPELAKSDSNYIRSAAHNCNHFRNPVSQTWEDWKREATLTYTTNISDRKRVLRHKKRSKYITINERARVKPQLVSSAWYSQLHATALELAGSPVLSDQAAAWIFEGFALHYLQDGTAAGHIISPTTGGSGLTTLEHHDKANETGVRVTVKEACKHLVPTLGLTALEEGCKHPTVVVHGDEHLDDKNSAVTEDLAVLLTYVSLAEFGAAFNQAPLMTPFENEKNYRDDPHWTFDYKEMATEDSDLQISMFKWWESAGTKEATSYMAEATQLHIAKGHLKAMSLWPSRLFSGVNDI